MEDARLARASVWVELSDRPAQASDEEGFFHLTGVSAAETLVRASQLGPWDTGYITFSGGVPVGGYSNLVLYPNGAINFSGHAHVSGAPGYDYSFVWAVKDSNVPATVYVFAASGRLHGTFESGSRDVITTGIRRQSYRHWQQGGPLWSVAGRGGGKRE